MPPTPKHPSARRRRNKTPGARTLSAVADAEIPKLPTQGKRRWRAMTKRWWADVWSSPMAPEFDESDFVQLVALAVLFDDFWRTAGSSGAAANAQLMSEIRLQSQRYGLSPIDRRRMQWEIERGEEAEERTRRRRNEAGPKPAASKGQEDPRKMLAG